MKERLWNSVCRNKHITGLWIATFFIFSVLFFNGFFIAQLLEDKLMHMGEQIGGNVTLLHKENGVDDYPGKHALSVESEKKLGDTNGIKKVWKCAATLVYGSEDFAFISVQKNGKDLPRSETSGTMIYCTDVNEHPAFRDRKAKIIKGRMLHDEDRGKIILSNYMDAGNQLMLRLGQTRHIRSFDGRVLPLEIVGFTDDSGNDGWPWSSYSSNFLFSDEKTVLDAQVEKGYREVRYEFKTADAAEQFAAAIKDMEIPEYEQLNIVLDTTEYAQVKSTYENIYHVVIVTLIFILVIGSLIVVLLMGYLTLERKKEIGILLSMGESKVKIWMQLTGEVLLPMIVAEVIGVVVSLFLKGIIANELLGEVFSITLGQVEVSPRLVLYMMLCNIALAGVTGVLLFIQISRYQVKKLLEDG